MADQVQWEFPANLAGSIDACSRCESWILERGYPSSTAFRALMILEELFTNTVKFGGDLATSGEIRLGLKAQPGSVVLVYADTGKAFDPLHTDSGADAASGTVGGQGLRMIQGLTDEAHYCREKGWNLLNLTICGTRDCDN